MVVKGDETNLIHLSEINTLLVDSTMVTISSYLIAELLKVKVKVIFCDEKRNPMSEIVPYYGCYNTSKKITQQIAWNPHFQQLVWTHIIKQKIMNQAKLLKMNGFSTYEKLMEYANELEFFDTTNREGHAAKVYFNSLFGKSFVRDAADDINAGLNYGYAIILSAFNKEIACNGFLTQLGIKHTNVFNQFNLSSDLMEPFRVLIDDIVFKNKEEEFDQKYKMKLVDVLNKKVYMDGKVYYVENAIQLYLKNIFDAFEEQALEKVQFFEFV